MLINDISVVAFGIGPVEVRWYGLMFAAGIGLNYLILTWAFKRHKYPLEDLDSLVVWLFFGLLFGARLGHVFFYEWGYYSQNLLEILQVWKGGLASHGAIIGLFVAYLGWCKFRKVGTWKYLDVVAIGMPLTGMFVRIGNYFNSEILGKPFDGWGSVVFKSLGEDFGRYPVQLYEAGFNLAIFVIAIWAFWKYYKKMPRGFYVSLVLGLYFVARFVAEFYKKRMALPEGFPLSMGQILSLVLITGPVVYFIFIMPKLGKREA